MTDPTHPASDQSFTRGDAVTYWYGRRKVHATVYAMSLTGKRVRISYRNSGNTWDEHVYVKPQSLERGHV